MHPGIDFGYFEFPEFADAVSGEIFLFKVHIYGLPAHAEIFCDFFDGEPSVFYQIKLFHCNIPETPKLSFFRKRCHHIPFGIIYQYYRENNITSNPSLNVFLDIYCYYLYNVYLFILKITKRTIFKIKGLEKEYKIPLSVNGYVLNGKIDKVSTCIIKGKEYAVVLDYKTGTSNIDLNKIIHGHDMQLLFYFYFLSQEQEVSFAGGYLQHILPNNVLQKDKNKNYNELLNDFYKYTGYSNSDLTVLSSIDREFDNES